MGVIVKKCLACGTINQYVAKECKKCHSPLLAEVDQDDEIMSIDPMEAAVNEAVSKVDIEDDLVVKILREQAEAAKQIVAKENEKEEKKRRKKERAHPTSFGGGPSAVANSGSYNFTIGGEDDMSKRRKNGESGPSGTTYGGFDGSEKAASEKYGFKISKGDGPVHSDVISPESEASATWSRTQQTSGKKKNRESKNDKWKIKKGE